MINVKTTANGAKEATEVFVKTGTATTARIVGGYQVTGNADAKVLKQFYEYGAACDEHSYVITERVEATCTASGYVKYTCSACGVIKSDIIPATGHLYSTNVIEATCTEDGYTEYICSNCGDRYTVKIPATGHSYTSETVEATCTEDGYTTYTCDLCGDSYTEIIPATGHSEVLVKTVAATCGVNGYKLYECTVCGEQRTETIPATGTHTLKWVNYAESGGTDDSFHRQVCTVCGWKSNELLDCMHETITEATCTKSGISRCSVCGHERTIPATGHREYVNPFYEHPSNHEYICSVCGEHIKYEAHSKGDLIEVVPPVCGVSDGYSEYYCAVCGTAYKTDDIIAEDSHNENLINKSEPTCGVDGYKEYVCSICGHSRKEIIPATGEHVEKVVGYGHASTHDVVCSVCGKHIKYEAHTKGELIETVPPICGERDGYSEYYCSKCGNAYKTDYVMAEDSHDWEEIESVEPTCITDGWIEYVCNTCGHRRTETVPATGKHTEILNQDYSHTTNHEYVCSVCGEHTRYEYHTKGKLIEIVPPICGERDGYSEYYCSKCGNAFKTDDIIAEDSHYDIAYTSYVSINGEYGRHKATCSACGLEWDEDCTPDDFGICTCCGESVM